MRTLVKLLFLGILLVPATTLSSKAQIVIKGQVLVKGSGKPLAYANIGILNSSIGTISNHDGTFQVVVPSKYVEQQLIFSSVGYQSQSHKIKELHPQSKLRILLEEQVLELNAIEISKRKKASKSIRLGNNRSLLLSGQLYNDTASAGSAMALLINKSDYLDYDFVHEAQLYIARNKMPEFKIRLRFKAIDKDGLPGKDLYPYQVIQTSQITKGWLRFNPPEMCFLEEDQFFVVFEWILEKKDRKFIANQYALYMEEHPDRVSYDTVMIAGKPVAQIKVPTVVTGTIFGTTNNKSDREQQVCYQRSHSFASWERSSGILSAKVTLGNGPK